MRGIPVRVHWTLLLILPILASAFARNYTGAAELAGVPEERLTWAPWLWGLLVAVGLFASVLLHELAHSLYALGVGLPVRGINLLMIGGISEIGETPKRPRDEAWMAAVGPATSLVLGAALAGAGLALAGTGAFNLVFALMTLGQLNLFLGVFNLLPAFPMDGGRILRALLAGRMGPLRATRAAATVGKAFAAGFVLLGLFTGSFMLLLVAFFVWTGAEAEGGQVAVREVLGDVRVATLAGPPGATVDGTETVDVAVARMLDARRLALPVLAGDRVVGVLALDDVRDVPYERRSLTLVREIARAVAPVGPGDAVWTALQRMSEHEIADVPVVEDGRLVGVISQGDVLRGVRLRELQNGKVAGRPGLFRPRRV
ncbi:MAG: site-2 protease family protein [Myxococcota bacterium]